MENSSINREVNFNVDFKDDSSCLKSFINIINKVKEKDKKLDSSVYAARELKGGTASKIFVISSLSRFPLFLEGGFEFIGCVVKEILPENVDNEFEKLVKNFKLGIGPQPCIKCKNAISYQYLVGNTLDAFENNRNFILENIYKLVPKTLSLWHKDEKLVEKDEIPFLEKMLLSGPYIILNAGKGLVAKLDKCVKVSGKAESLIDLIQKCAMYLKKIKKGPVRFCHNDIHHGNILLSSKNNFIKKYEKDNLINESITKDHIIFIDLEYVGNNYVIAELATLFREFYGSDLSKYPECHEMLLFIDNYMKLVNFDNFNCLDCLKGVREITPFVDLQWCIWAIEKSTKKIKTDFDYEKYAEMRLKLALEKVICE